MDLSDMDFKTCMFVMFKEIKVMISSFGMQSKTVQ